MAPSTHPENHQSQTHAVLVVGGYGNFGQTICRALAQDADIRLLIGGRDGARAEAFAASLESRRAVGLAMDVQAAGLAATLRSLGIDTLIHTAGPFQGSDYRVAEACIAAGCNYLDLADGRSFVASIGVLDERARAAGVLVACGASSVPALTSAVVDGFLPEFSELCEIRHGISAGSHTPGLATMQGVLGYCGKPFTRLERGAWTTTHGWQDLHRHKYPAPVGDRWLGSCDVPDLEVFPKRYPSLHSVAFHAGVGNPLSHLSTWILAGLVRMGWLDSLVPLAPAMRRINAWLAPFGPEVSAMHVGMRGTGLDGRELVRTWHLTAFDNHGPDIPCGASIALARKLAAGQMEVKGAMPCVGLLTLAEYLDTLAHLNITQTES